MMRHLEGQVCGTSRLTWPLAATLLFLSLVLGGGQGTLGDALCQGLATVLIALVLWRHATDPAAALPRVAWLAIIPLALPLLQLLPAPDTLWTSSPARTAIAAQLQVADAQGPRTLSLVPFATETSLLWLMPAVALFLAGLQFNAKERARLAALFVGVALVGMVVGATQLFGGPDSPLYFYAITNPGSTVGFFANRNHFAAQLVLALPFVLLGTALWWSDRRDQGHGGVLLLAVGAGMAVLLILGLALAKSRAGLLLGMLAIALSLPALMGLRRKRGTRRVLGVAVAIGVLLGVQFALFGILQRFQVDALDDARFQYASITAQAAAEHTPQGAGLGAFRRAFEGYDLGSPGSAYINHAHNDYAELWLDGGWLALALGLALGLSFVLGTWRRWRQVATVDGDVLLGRAASIGLAMLALHSLGDYPLRTTALLASAGLLAAMLCPAARRAARADAEKSSFAATALTR